MSQKQSN